MYADESGVVENGIVGGVDVVVMGDVIVVIVVDGGVDDFNSWENNDGCNCCGVGDCCNGFWIKLDDCNDGFVVNCAIAVVVSVGNCSLWPCCRCFPLLRLCCCCCCCFCFCCRHFDPADCMLVLV